MLGRLGEYKREAALALGVCAAGYALWRIYTAAEAEEAHPEPAERPRKRAPLGESSASSHSFNDLNFIPTRQFIALAQPLVREGSAPTVDLSREDVLRVYQAAGELMAFDRDRLAEQMRLGLGKCLGSFEEYQREFAVWEQAAEQLRAKALAYMCNYAYISLDALTRRKLELSREDPAFAGELQRTCCAPSHASAAPAAAPSREDLLRLFSAKRDIIRNLVRQQQRCLNRKALERYVRDAAAAKAGLAETALDPQDPLLRDEAVLALRNEAEALLLELQIKGA